MENSKSVKTLNLIMGILLAVSIIGGVMAFAQTTALTGQINELVGLVAYLLALYYVTRGYEKNAAFSYKLAMYGFAWAFLTKTAIAPSVGSSSNVMVGNAFLALTFGLVLVLAVAENLGKKKSLIFAGTGLTLQVILTLMVFTNNSEMNITEGYSGIVDILSICEGLISSAVIFLMVLGKYRDKDARGSF